MEKVYVHICLSRGWLRRWKYFKYFAVDEVGTECKEDRRSLVLFLSRFVQWKRRTIRNYEYNGCEFIYGYNERERERFVSSIIYLEFLFYKN